ncbi:MAG: hypothetical protein COW01_14960 [Bdellovibrionales bacterium CG12_big_fil_rev_8_21_14_0_65_38_15]|nr:MAG: hypothetical protein COW79_09780 [Bdellovibrionales bacterium CG22_combo_CG10-13_8_21_14_all_38_13]PIQ52737.1 MAG: hypothetical protein COW01_14960 [Bdellovibrionales bacterium CG12_big_fil_rev_8_21_14_0_65_38_15]PIR31425.1 MAG: hypothetical protein COV38_00470 [Bdellovibrionales bacterium CG11_big_fil_rev_8_21_14_0_20_38_13]
MDSDNKTDGFVLPRNILLIESDPNLRKLLVQNLEVYTGSKVIIKRDADELIDFLKRDDFVPDLIISENMAGDEYTILKVYYFVNSQKLDVPVILLGENPKIKGKVEEVSRTDWQQVIKKAAALMTVTAEQMIELNVPEYYPFPTGILRGSQELGLSVFKKQNESYKVWRDENSKFNEEEIEELLLDGIDFLYILNTDRLEFAKSVSARLEQLLTNEKDTKNLVGLTGESFNTVATLLSSMGITESTIKASQATINAIEKIANSSPKLEDLLSILLKNPSSIAWKHCLMTAVVSQAMLDNVDWGTNEQKAKLVFAAFFHDICIPQDHLATIHTGGELFESDLKKEEKVRVEKHAFSACELLQNHPDVPYGAENIILQHHGVPNGIGFPEDHLDNRITPLAIIFRVAEDYVHQLLDRDEKPDPFFVLKGILQRYTKGEYLKAAEALKAAHPKLVD